MDEEDFPHELDETLEKFESKVQVVEKTLHPLLNNERRQLVTAAQSLDVIKMDLVTAYAINSLFWSYLVIQGVNPKTNPVKQELDRIKTYMLKVEQIKNKKYAPKLNKGAAQRFIRNAMFETTETDDKAENVEKDSKRSHVSTKENEDAPPKRQKRMKKQKKLKKATK